MEAGKYQAIRLHNTAALILDTQEGHLWLWGVHGEDTGFTLFYMGQASPGKKLGDLIYHVKDGQVNS